MHIQNRIAIVLYDSLVGILALFATWVQFLQFGNDAWRLFPTWVALIAGLYFLTDAIAALIFKRRPIGAEVSPVLQGGLIVSGLVLLVARIVYYALDSYVPATSGNILLTDIVLPILMLLSWAIFSIKGKWRAYDPFYWLGLITIYVASILASGELMSRSARFIYPYEFLDYPTIGIDGMLWWSANLIAIILIIGYVLWLLDFTLSGQLAECIVMPRIKTVVIEEEITDEDEPENIRKLEEKPVRLVTTGARNLPPGAKAASRLAADNVASRSGSAQPKTTHPGSSKAAQSPAEVRISKNKSTSNPNSESKNTNKPKTNPNIKTSSQKSSKSPTVRIIEKIDFDNERSSAKSGSSKAAAGTVKAPRTTAPQTSTGKRPNTEQDRKSRSQETKLKTKSEPNSKPKTNPKPKKIKLDAEPKTEPKSSDSKSSSTSSNSQVQPKSKSKAEPDSRKELSIQTEPTQKSASDSKADTESSIEVESRTKEPEIKPKAGFKFGPEANPTSGPE